VARSAAEGGGGDVLGTGAAWMWFPGWLKLLRRVQNRPRRMFDSSATSRPGARVATPTGFASVDLDRLRTRLAASDGTAPDAPPGTAVELARLLAELLAALDRYPGRVPRGTPAGAGAAAPRARASASLFRVHAQVDRCTR